jgi:hypothetical protein
MRAYNSCVAAVISCAIILAKLVCAQTLGIITPYRGVCESDSLMVVSDKKNKGDKKIMIELLEEYFWIKKNYYPGVSNTWEHIPFESSLSRDDYIENLGNSDGNITVDICEPEEVLVYHDWDDVSLRTRLIESVDSDVDVDDLDRDSLDFFEKEVKREILDYIRDHKITEDD